MSTKKGPNKKKMSVEDQDVLSRYGALIRKYRKMSAISRGELCKKLDISNSQLSAWENGRAEPRLHSMLRMCDILNIPLGEFLYDTSSLDMTEDDIRLVKILREYPSSARKHVLNLLTSLLEAQGDTTPSPAPIKPEVVKPAADAEYAEDKPIIEDETDADEAPAVTNVPVETAVSEQKSEPAPVEKPKKKRGRPRKDSAAQKTTPAQPALTQPALTEKKKRGRPRKAAQAVVAPEPQNKRGRPSKTDSAPQK